MKTASIPQALAHTVVGTVGARSPFLEQGTHPPAAMSVGCQQLTADPVSRELSSADWEPDLLALLLAPPPQN